MLRTRSGLALLASSTLLAIAVLAVARPVLADDVAPTPLPGAISGPSGDTLIGTSSTYGLSCQTFAAPPIGEQWACNREAAPSVYYGAQFATNDPLVMEAFVSGDLPWPEDHDQFLTDMAAAFCAPENRGSIIEFMTIARNNGLAGTQFEDDLCLLYSDYTTDPVPYQKLIAWVKGGAAVPTAVPTLSPFPEQTLPPVSSPTPSPTPSAAPVATDQPSPTPVFEPALPPDNEGGDGNSDGPGKFVTSVAAPTAVSVDPLVLIESLGLALLVVLLMPFPAQLFNSTYETHPAGVRRFFRLDLLQRATGPLSGFWDSLVGILLFVLLSGVVYALLDPNLSLSPAGFATILGLALGILLTGLLASAPPLIKSVRAGETFKLRVLPATLLIGLGCVVISRLTGFLPGYVYGVVLGVVFARELSKVEQGRANALAAAGMLGVALVSWLLLGFIAGANLGLPGIVASTLLATLLVACLEGVVFGLLPFRFLPGEPMYATNRVIWAVLLLVGAFCFFHILINPASGYLSSTTRTPLFTMIALFVGFAALSIGFWAYFRNKPIEG